MAFRRRRENLRAILSGSACIRPGSVYDAISIRIAEDIGFEVGMFGGSVGSLAVLGAPNQGYGNALNARRTVQELEAAGAAGLTIEDTLLPQAFGVSEPQLIP